MACLLLLLLLLLQDAKKEDIQSPSDQEISTTTSSNAETTPPTVKFSFPHANDTLFDSITIKIKATDSGGVASMQLKVDGVSLGIKTAAPYNFGWNTKTVMNGAHQLSAIAIDASRNSRTKKITVHTLNPGALSIEQDLINLINQERANRGLDALTPNSKLLTAARTHSTDMAENNFFGHAGSDGSTLGVRLNRVGYPWTGATENLAASQTNAIDVFNAWIANTGQRGNMTDPNMRDIGVGGAYAFSNSQFHWYWTGIFSRTQ